MFALEMKSLRLLSTLFLFIIAGWVCTDAYHHKVEHIQIVSHESSASHHEVQSDNGEEDVVTYVVLPLHFLNYNFSSTVFIHFAPDIQTSEVFFWQPPKLSWQTGLHLPDIQE